MPSLTPDQTKGFLASISSEIPTADRDKKINRTCDIICKILILIMGAGIVITSGISAADIYPTMTKTLSTASAILGGLMTAVSAFANHQFDFAKRQSTYATKASALRSLRDELILNPDAQTFFDRLAQIRSWNYNNPPAQLTSPKPASQDGDHR